MRQSKIYGAELPGVSSSVRCHLSSEVSDHKSPLIAIVRISNTVLKIHISPFEKCPLSLYLSAVFIVAWFALNDVMLFPSPGGESVAVYLHRSPARWWSWMPPICDCRRVPGRWSWSGREQTMLVGCLTIPSRKCAKSWRQGPYLCSFLHLTPSLRLDTILTGQQLHQFSFLSHLWWPTLCWASVTQRQSVGLGIERSRVRNPLW